MTADLLREGRELIAAEEAASRKRQAEEQAAKQKKEGAYFVDRLDSFGLWPEESVPLVFDQELDRWVAHHDDGFTFAWRPYRYSSSVTNAATRGSSGLDVVEVCPTCGERFLVELTTWETTRESFLRALVAYQDAEHPHACEVLGEYVEEPEYDYDAGELAVLGRRVVAAWETGELAAAVNALRIALEAPLDV